MSSLLGSPHGDHTGPRDGPGSPRSSSSDNSNCGCFRFWTVVQYCDIMRFMILCDRHHKVSPKPNCQQNSNPNPNPNPNPNCENQS